MTPLSHARQIVDTMLGYLGFTVKIDELEGPEGPTLQLHTEDSQLLIGRRGATMEDIQYLVNRILRRHKPDAERVKVDCGHFRSIQEDRLQEEVKSIAERVKTSGKSFQMRPLNAYYRRLVHNVLVGDPGVVSSSPGGDDRLKRITVSPKQTSAPAE